MPLRRAGHMTALMCSLFSIRMAMVSPSRRSALRNRCANRLARASRSSKVTTVPDGGRMTAGLLCPICGRICMGRLHDAHLDGCDAGAGQLVRSNRAVPAVGQQQGAVAEFVPQIAVCDGFAVG